MCIRDRDPAMLGRLDHPGVLVGAEGEPVRALDAGVEEHLDRSGDGARIARIVARQCDRLVRRRLGYPDDLGRLPAVEHRHVLRPVSYTHLDVYKRQRPVRTGR